MTATDAAVSSLARIDGRLLRSHAVNFRASDANDCSSRFVRLFRETWRLIPLTHRRSILRHWRRRGYVATIEIATYWSGFRPQVSGQCSLMGHQVRFYSHFVRLASDDDIRYVIAHELAHVWQWATKPDTRPAGPARASDAWEAEARRLGLEWLGLTRCPRRTPGLKAHDFSVLVELFKNANAAIPANAIGDNRRFDDLPGGITA